MSTRTQYEADLAALKESLAKMSQLSADAVEDALEALCTADAEEAKGIVKGDTEVNRMERDIEHRCMTLLLRQQPVAGDLRRISTAMKVVTDVERIGDHASDIAEIIPHLVTVRKEGDPAVSQAIKMGQKAHKMILDALNALTAEDEQAALRVIAADDEVDYDFNAIKHTLAQEIAADPGKVDAAMDALDVPTALIAIFEVVQRANKYIDETAPWALAKDGEIHAVARWRLTGELGEAEFGIVVEDAWQRRGLARVLMAHIETTASERGVTRLVGHVLKGNEAMQGMMTAMGYTLGEGDSRDTDPWVKDISIPTNLL